MTTNSTRQTDRELDVFSRFISAARLPINPDSVQKCDPPVPDILCRHKTDGPIAFELTELIDHGFSAGRGRQSKLQSVLETLHRRLSAVEKCKFDQQFGNANLYFSFHSRAATHKVRGNLFGAFRELSSLPTGFQGTVSSFVSQSVRKIVQSVSISRGGFIGPIFSVKSNGGLGDSVTPTIRKKLAKTYESDHPIELLGYLDVAGMFPPQLWRGPAAALLADVSELGLFRRIWVIDIRSRTVEIVHSVA